MTYQDYFLKGDVLRPGQRDCATRYALIEPIVARYTRPVTVLDLGANLGYFGLRLAHDLGAVSVMIDDGDDLVTTCAANDLPTTIALQRRLTCDDLEELAACEHFDVVLALNILHHFEDYRRALRAVLRLGEHILIEVPGPDDTGACGQDRLSPLRALLDAESPRLLGLAPSHTTPGVMREILHLTRPKRELTKPYWGSERLGAPPMRAHTILSTHHEKAFVMAEKDEARTWFPGINLMTYLQCGGVWPRPSRVATVIQHAYDEALTEAGFINLAHGDVAPWNFVLRGDRATLIDWNDPRQCEHDDTLGLQHTLRAVERPSAAYEGRT